MCGWSLGLFGAFDENLDSHIDFKEMACGISACCRGPMVEKHKCKCLAVKLACRCVLSYLQCGLSLVMSSLHSDADVLPCIVFVRSSDDIRYLSYLIS